MTDAEALDRLRVWQKAVETRLVSIRLFDLSTEVELFCWTTARVCVGSVRGVSLADCVTKLEAEGALK